MAQLRRFVLAAAATLLLGCTHAQLVKSGDAMIRVERGTQGVVEGVVVYKDQTKKTCIDKNLETAEERAECVAKALRAVEVSEDSVKVIKEALRAYWTLYPVLEAKFQNGERPTQEELAELASRAADVYAAFKSLVQGVKEAKQ